MSIDALGFVGGILLVIGFIPQVYIAFKTKKVERYKWPTNPMISGACGPCNVLASV